MTLEHNTHLRYLHLLRIPWRTMSWIIPSVIANIPSRELETVTLTFSASENWGDQEDHNTTPTLYDFGIFAVVDRTLADHTKFPSFRKLVIDANGTTKDPDRPRLLGSFPQLGSTDRFEVVDVDENKLQRRWGGGLA